MNLHPIHPKRGINLRCARCETWTTDTTAFYDREGIPFTDFYCDKCAHELSAIAFEEVYRNLWSAHA